MPNDTELAQKIQATARIGIWLSTLAVLLILGAGTYFVWLSLTDPATFAHEVQSELDLTGPVPEISSTQALLITAIWLVTYAVGMAVVWTIRSMFVGIRIHGIFTVETARRIRRCGWLVISLFPVSTFVIGIATALMTHWSSIAEPSIVFVVNEADIHSGVLGLVLVALGQIMSSAVQISNENKAFV